MFKKTLSALNKIRKILFAPIPLLILVILLSLGAGYIFIQYQKSQDQVRKLSNVQAKEEAKSLLSNVGKLIELPTGEEPTIATVTDKDKLSDQPFFQRAQNGDKVIIYTQDKRVILFRPSLNKVIDITPITTDSSPAPAASPTTSAKPAAVRVALYNGTVTPGVTNRAADRVRLNYEQASVVLKESAKKTDYTQTTIVDLTGTNAELATKMATTFGGSVGALPEGETKPDADILIILAK